MFLNQQPFIVCVQNSQTKYASRQDSMEGFGTTFYISRFAPNALCGIHQNRDRDQDQRQPLQTGRELVNLPLSWLLLAGGSLSKNGESERF